MADPVDSFIAEAGAAGVRMAILAAQREWDLTDARGFGPVSRARLIAYAEGRVIAADVPGDEVDLDAIAARIRAAGFRLERRSRNNAS